VGEYDYSRIGSARREAIRALDEYGCTVTEQCAAFGGISEATFHRYAADVRLRRRPVKPLVPGCTFDYRYDAARLQERSMPGGDGLEIATIALIRARENFTAAEIINALHASKSVVYRQRSAHRERLGDLSPAQQRWRHRHLPSQLSDFQTPMERAWAFERRVRCWVSRPRRREYDRA
jgi:hypothetical protein